ncbi:MAG TPA: guanosine-3',5'-bis(diphosphate) 3'-pyrophosphohydrolase, partial [Oxalobacteraceae bacterium]|nr:guanosine-3',5'-bis(diphosphate) 3'-pyrophosphohydrolase [Oxalobacteraceae bacterium]
MDLTPTDSTLSVARAKRAAPRRSPSKTASSPIDPTLTPLPGAGVASVTQLNAKLAEYLTPAELKKVKEAYRFSDEMHLGQMRMSG